MGLYDDAETMGEAEAHAERQRRFAPVAHDVIARLQKLAPLVVTARAPHARSTAMAPVLAELDAAIAKASELGALSSENSALVETARAIVATARDDEAAAIVQRRRDELALLAEQLALREDEIVANQSLQSVAVVHLTTLHDRLAALASEGADAAVALAARAAKAKANVPAGLDPRNRAGAVGPSWAEVEGAVTTWLAETWKERCFRVEREEAGMSASLAPGLNVHEVLVKAYVVAAFGAVTHRLRVGLVTTDGGWAVKTLSVRA